MSTNVWGNLPKAQDDDETIEEAIIRLIAAHNDDADAHLAAGQSLQSHAASEIIDHVAESIVADKIAERNVNIDHLENFGRMIKLDLTSESTDSWTKDETGGGAITSYVGNIGLIAGAGEDCNMYTNGVIPSGGKPLHLRFVIYIPISFDESSDTIAYITVGRTHDGQNNIQGLGFKIIDQKLYGVWNSNDEYESPEHTIELCNLVANTYYNCELIYTPNVSMEFYVDDTLEATVTTTLPDDETVFNNTFRLAIENVGTSNASMGIMCLYLQTEL